jgi:nitrile hydratase accessory protein
MHSAVFAAQDWPALPRDADGPLFKEPWEAHAFALAVRLSEAGWFSWNEWAAALNREIHTAQAQGDPDLGNTYYHHWLRALEQLCAQKGLVAGAEAQRRQEEWRQAYLHTPHGQPVVLANAAACR